MHSVACLLLLVVAFSQYEAAEVTSGTYSVFLPKYVRPGVPTKFVVEIIKSENPISVTATLESKDFSSTVTQVIESGESKTLEFEMIPFDYEGSNTFNVMVVGVDDVTGEEFFKDETDKGAIQYQKKFLSIFIQTDKAIYQPSQTIKFRAVVTTSDLLPFDGAATYKLTDPSGNVIIMEKDAVLTSGVVGSEFRLGRYATLGTWSITYEVHGFQEQLSVSVEEYKLPKFKVEIKTDKTFLHPGSKSLNIEISAKFTFGQPVKGTARLEVSLDRYVRRGTVAQIIMHRFPEFSGSDTHMIEARDIESTLGWNPKHYSSPLKITAFVKDKNSGDEFNETTTVDLQRLRLKVEAIAKPENIKPGLPYTAYIKVSEQDGTLLSAEERENLGMFVEIQYNYPRYPNWTYPTPKKMSKNLTVGDDGIAILEIITQPDNFERIYFNIRIDSYPVKTQYWSNWNAERFESPSDTYLQVSTMDSTLTVGEVASIDIHTTDEPSDTYWVLILARGRLIRKDAITPSSYVTEEHSYKFTYDFDVTTEMSPSVYVVVSYVRPDSEIVGDSMKITVQAQLLNKVSITTSTDETDAGKPVSITVNAAPGSFVGLRAIDQSVLLLKQGNDITQTKIFEDLDQYGPTTSYGWGGGFGRRWWPYPIGGADVKEVFDNSGVLVLTDALLYSKEPEFPEYYYALDDGLEMAAFAPAVARNIAVDDSTSPILTRTFFPETWIWTEHYAGPDGTTTFHYDTPDTITTWELSSFAVSDTKGLGVTEKNSKLTVFRKFFISLNLPPTMIRGEILNMRTTVYNYFEHDLQVNITLKENDWYDLVIVGDDPIAAGPKRSPVIPPQDAVTIVFPIRLKKAGVARISVMARSEIAGDEVERTIVVKPEGIPKTVSHSTIIDRQSENEPPTVSTFDVMIPMDAVPGSVYTKFLVSGNILGNALSNLGNLLRMPSGCGEQTMISFSPDVFISLYLQKVGQLTGELKQKSKSHLQEGYNNELRYQRADGSFSAFGSADRDGSTWLTMFVLKSFIAAKQLDSNLIQDSVLNRAVKFMLSQQNRDGTFREPGRVIHKDMQGGVENDVTLAAYGIIAVTEGNYFKKNEDVEVPLAKTKKLLEDRAPRIRDPYTLSIVAYALSLVESSKLVEVMKRIDSSAIVSGTTKHWGDRDVSVSRCGGAKEHCPFDDNEASSSSIEITAYNLLTYVKMGRMNDVMPIVRWLVEQRGQFGGYQSTQDTVMAIQALSTVAGFFSDRPVDLTVDVTHDGNADFSEQFSLHKDNTIVLQSVELPPLSGTVSVSGTGVGFGDVQTIVSYNLPTGPRSDEPFRLDISVTKKMRGDLVIVKACSKINQDRDEVVKDTGMFVISLILPSGYTIDDKEATRENPGVKLIELVGDEVSGYFDELPRNTEICMTLKMTRYAQVADVKPQLATAFDYYKPARKALRMYHLVGEEGGICAICGADCVGCPPIILPPEPEMNAYCYAIDPIPCPDYFDGLYYDMNSHITYMLSLPEHTPANTCSVPKGATDSPSFRGLPGTYLDGTNEYIRCDKTDVFKHALMSSEGFTISLLVNPHELTQSKRYTIFSIGRDGMKKSFAYLEKRPRVNQYWFRLRLNGFELTARSIYLYDIPLHTWRHVVVVFDGRADVKMYVNGYRRGKMISRKTKTDEVGDKVTMNLGRSHDTNPVTRGDFIGLLSNLDIWLEALSAEQIMDQYRFYKNVMNEQNPLLTVPHIHHSIPKSLWKCFEDVKTSSELKSRKGQLRTSCENGGKPVNPIPPDILFPPPPIFV